MYETTKLFIAIARMMLARIELDNECKRAAKAFQDFGLAIQDANIRIQNQAYFEIKNLDLTAHRKN